MKIRVSRLTDRENEESQNCNEAISSYNPMYADTLLGRQLQDEESNPLEQRVDALIKKRYFMNHSKKSTFNSHYIKIPQDHEQTIQIGPSGYDSKKLQDKNIEDTVIQPLMNITMQSRYPFIMVVMATHLLAIFVVVSVEFQRYLMFILVLLLEQIDTYLGSVHKCNH